MELKFSISAYYNCIRSANTEMYILDPSGVTLNILGQPFQVINEFKSKFATFFPVTTFKLLNNER